MRDHIDMLTTSVKNSKGRKFFVLWHQDQYKKQGRQNFRKCRGGKKGGEANIFWKKLRGKLHGRHVLFSVETGL